MGFPPASVPEGFQRASGKPFGAPAGAYPLPPAGNDAPTSTRNGTCRLMGFPPNFGARRFPKGERKALWCACRRMPPYPGWRMTRRLRRGRRACSPKGRSHFSFGGERKVYKRKPAARRLREKGFYCPFCRRGSLCRAQHDWPAFTCDPARSELAFFRRQNGRAFFPPLPIAALAPAVGVRHTQALRVGMLRCGLDIFATQKASVGSNPRWHL